MPSPPDGVGEDVMFSGCSSYASFGPDRSRHHDISWTPSSPWTTLIKLTRNIHSPVLMTWLDSAGQRSRSQQAVEMAEASTSTLRRRSLSRFQLHAGCPYVAQLTVSTHGRELKLLTPTKESQSQTGLFLSRSINYIRKEWMLHVMPTVWLHCWVFEVAIFVPIRDVKLQLTD